MFPFMKILYMHCLYCFYLRCALLTVTTNQMMYLQLEKLRFQANTWQTGKLFVTELASCKKMYSACHWTFWGLNSKSQILQQKQNDLRFRR